MGNAVLTLMHFANGRLVVANACREVERGHWSAIFLALVAALASPPSMPLVAAGITGLSRAGVTQPALSQDFDDLHEFNIVESIRTDASDGSGAVQVVNVIWLGDSQAESTREGPNFRIPQFAEALRIRDWQSSGMDGGSLESRESQDIAESPSRSEVLVDNGAQPNGFGITYGIGTLGTERRRRTDIDLSIFAEDS